MNSFYKLILILLLGLGCSSKKHHAEKANSNDDFPLAMVQFIAYPENPVFEGTGKETWDKQIRERGYILFEDGMYKMWYTGYNYDISDVMHLGYATSQDGIHWKRQSEQPILGDNWIEDMYVVKDNGIYYMVAEGVGDIAHLLTSNDGLTWTEEGDIKILDVNGEPISEGPYGTPTVWIEHDKKYLFYERNDEAIWLATSDDFKTWKNVQDEPVLEKGPGAYDAGAVAANQVVKYNGKYYMYYHASSNPDWMQPGINAMWSSNVAMSMDLIHWVKYPDNPIVDGDHSSPILVFVGTVYRLYTMHDKVWRYDPKE